MRKFLLITAVLLPLLLVTVAVYLLHQPEFVSRQLERLLSDATGWQLEIAGGLDLRWGRSTVIEAREVRLVNPNWPPAAELFTAGELWLEFRPLELLHRKLDLRRLILRDCRAQLERDGEGGSNWSLSADPDAAGPEEEGGPAEESGFSWSLLQLEVESCNLLSRMAGQEKPVEIQLDRADLQVDDQQVLQLSASGAIDRQQLALDGSLQPLPALWQGGSLQHALDLQAGEVRLHSEGSVAELATGQAADLNLRFSGPDFARITTWLALPEISQGEFDASIAVQRQASGENMTIAIDADLGSLEVSGSGELDRILGPSGGNFKLQVVGPDLDALGRTFGVEGLLAQPFEAEVQAGIESGITRLQNLSIRSGDNHMQGSGVLGRWPGLAGSDLKFELRSADLSAWLQPRPGEARLLGGLAGALRLVKDQQSHIRLEAGGQLEQYSSTTLHDFSLAAEVRQQDDFLQLDRLDLRLGADRISMSGEVRPRHDFRGSELELELQLADLAASSRWLGLSNLPSRPVQWQARLARPDRGLRFTVTADRDSGQKIHLSGDMPDLAQPLALNAQFDIDLPSLQLAQFLVPGTPLPDAPLLARGQVHNDPKTRRTRVQDVAIRLGRTEVQLQAELLPEQHLDGSTARWTLLSPDWRELCAGYCAGWPADLEPGELVASGGWHRKDGADYFEGLQFSTPLATLQASGQVESPAEAGGPAAHRSMQFSVDVQGEDASRLNPLLGPVFDSQGFALQATVEAGSGTIRSQGIQFRQGQTGLAADLEISLAERPAIRARVQSAVLDLTPLREHFLDERSGDAATAAKGQENAGQERLFPDEAIVQLAEMPADLQLDLDIGQLLLGAYRMREVRIQAELLSQSLRVSEFEFKGEHGGQYAGHFQAEQQDQLTRLNLFTRAEDLKLGLVGVSGQDPATLPPSDILVDLRGQGRTWHELAQSLNGKARWYSGSGRVSNTGMDFLFNDLLTQIFNTLNPLSKSSRYTELACGVYAADFVDGQVNVAPIVIRTGQITAFSSGQVDLAAETIDLSFRTVPRKGLGLSAGSVVNPFFKIGGTLMKPALQLDVTKGAISGGAMVATVGLSVLLKSLSDRLLASKDPCGDARAEIERADQVNGP